MITHSMGDFSDDCNKIRKAFETAAKETLDVLDLKRKNIDQIPSGLHHLKLSSLKCLYLEDNRISSLPEDFFVCLASLEWLDLRNNKLHEIPKNVGEHKSLKTLLLGRNQLTFLPAEIGGLKTLKGLNLSDNPLEEPPQSVVTQGVYAIKAYLLIKLGFDPEDYYSGDTESEYQTTENGENLTGDGVQTSRESDSLEDEKEGRNEGDMLSNDNRMEVGLHTTESVHPKVAMSYYGALLGEIPNSYIFKPWKPGVFFKKGNIKGKLSAQNMTLGQHDGERQ